LQSNLNNSWLLGYEFGNKLKVIIQGGIYCSIYLKANNNNVSYYYADSTEIAIINDPHISVGYHETLYTGSNPLAGIFIADPGFVGGIKFSYVLQNNFKINCSSRLYRGLINTLDRGRNRCNNSFNLNFGIIYKI